MYCILVTGIPAAGKSTMAGRLAERFGLPVISKDRIKELLYDDLGFKSRDEKVKLGIASMNIMYYTAAQLMKNNQSFILENNFEKISKEPLMEILERYAYTAITVTLTGNYSQIYKRFAERNNSPDRHPGHVVNDCYPPKTPNSAVKPISKDVFFEGGVRSVPLPARLPDMQEQFLHSIIAPQRFSQIAFHYFSSAHIICQCDKSENCQHKYHDWNNWSFHQKFPWVQIAGCYHKSRKQHGQWKSNQHWTARYYQSLNAEHFFHALRRHTYGHVSCEFSFPLLNKSQSI